MALLTRLSVSIVALLAALATAETLAPTLQTWDHRVAPLRWNVYDPVLGWNDRRAPEYVNAPDIAVVGDSFAAGSGVTRKEAWPAVLGSLLGERVHNAAVGAWGVDQMFLRAAQLVRERPKLLIVAAIPSDVGRCGLSRYWAPKPWYSLDAGALTLHDVPVPREASWKLLALWRAAARREVVPTGADPGEVARALVREIASIQGPRKALVLYTNGGPTPPRLAGLGLDVIDLGRIPDALLLATDPGRHPSPAGHRWIAERVASVLNSH